MVVKEQIFPLKESALWHPCGSMNSDFYKTRLHIHRAQGDYLYLENGQPLIDAIGSWWCKVLGHNHPRLQQALIKQLHRYEHAIHANTTCEVLEELAARLVTLSPGLKKVFFASDGACAVEIAMKLSLHTRQLTGEKNRKDFIALQGGYHGETCGALSVSDLGYYKAPYESLLRKAHFIGPLPFVNHKEDPLWKDASALWPAMEAQLTPFEKTATALILEPIVQGSNGMKIYSQDLLKRLAAWCNAHGVHLIADEIMTGLGRTGEMLASYHGNIHPDFITLSKGLTSGVLPCSVVLIHEKIYDLFVEKKEAFLHSHTFGGNPLAASVALECLKVLEEEKILERTQTLEPLLRAHMESIAKKTGMLKEIRNLGGLVAAQVEGGPKVAQQVCEKALTQGALLRPLGDVLYWFPPLNVKEKTLEELRDVTEFALS